MNKQDLKDNPLVSVLMTAYNREKYITFAIDSVLASTYTNFELIIVDDCSKDATVAIVKRFTLKDPRVKLFQNEFNLGDYPNRNKAASLASGKYLKYVDSDDYIYPDGLQIMVRSMEKFPGAGFGLCSLTPDLLRPFPFMLDPKQAYVYHYFGPGLFHKGPLTAIFLRESFNNLGGFKNIRMISDIDMWHRIGLKFPVVLMGGGIVWQRIHQEQELNDKGNYTVEGAKIKWEYLLAKECPLSLFQLKLIRKNRIRRYVGFIFLCFRLLKFHEARLYFQCLINELKVKIV